MPSWGEVLNEMQNSARNAPNPNPFDFIRRKYIRIMNEYTGRNIIAYYSGFLQHPRANVSIDDNDINAFMQTVYGLNKSNGLDLILHTPGGQIASTESIVTYLKSVFGNDIRVFVPQMAMSAGTMIALSAKEIVMGKHSNIGPIDPQFGGVFCAGVIEEFEKAASDIKMNPAKIPLWQSIISKYHPTFLGDCEKAIQWSKKMVKEWLLKNMLSESAEADELACNIVDKLSSHAETYAHSRHIHFDECEELGLNVVRLEDIEKREIENCMDLQDCVLTIHHSYMHTFSNTNAVKIVENNIGNAMIVSTPLPN